MKTTHSHIPLSVDLKPTFAFPLPAPFVSSGTFSRISALDLSENPKAEEGLVLFYHKRVTFFYMIPGKHN
jgi:hypothetical protein